MKTSLLLTLLSFLALPLLRAGVDAPSLLNGMSARIDAALNRDDAAALNVELAKCEALVGEKVQVPRALYYKGYILLNRASRLNPETEEAKAKSLYDAAEKALAESLKQAKDAETLSLHASTMERSISVRGGFSAMKLGPAASREHDEAAALAPNSPRVALLRGTSLLNRPGFVGGSPEKALAEFKRAAELAEKETDESSEANGWAPRWGKVEVWAWVGQAHEKLGQKDLAKAAYLKGLELDPEYGWIKHVLLPRVSQ